MIDDIREHTLTGYKSVCRRSAFELFRGWWVVNGWCLLATPEGCMAISNGAPLTPEIGGRSEDLSPSRLSTLHW